MHCNGKCHLMKELAKAAENEKPLSSDKKSGSHEQEVLFFQEIGSFAIRKTPGQVAQVNVAYSNLYAYTDNTPVFHPPTTLS